MAGYTDPGIDQVFDLTNDNIEALEIEPIWAHGKLTDRSRDYLQLRTWVTDTHRALIEHSRPRSNVQIKNLALWIGLHYKSQNGAGDFRDMDSDDVTVDTHKVVVNNIYDIERNRYSKITRNTPQTRPTPRTADFEDYAGSKIAGAVLETAKARVKQKKLLNKALRESFIFGDSWVYCGWNKDKGPIDPRWEAKAEKLERRGIKEARLNIDGESLIINVDQPIFVGDHELRVLLPWNKFAEPKNEIEEVEWVLEVKYEHVEVLKALYPKKAKDIRATDNAKSFNADLLYVQTLKNHALKYTLTGRSTKFLRNGIRFVMTPDTMLEKPDDNPSLMVDDSELGNLPYERITDIDVPGRLDGYSTIQILSSLQHSENQMHSMIKHYLMLLGTPKMVVAREAEVDIDELSDGSMTIHVSGGMANSPQMMVPSPVSPQIVAFAELLRDRIQKLGDLHGVSNGELPNNVKAARAIRLLQEMEDLRATSVFEKYNELYLAVDRKILSQTVNYKPTDGRLIQILGKGNEYLIEDFDPEIFARGYDMKLEVQGMLPQQPSVRAEFILNSQQISNGTLFTPEKLVKLLGFESEKEFIDAATVSVIKAERENEMFVKGKDVAEPEEYENHLVEMREHKVIVQSAGFAGYPKKLKQKVLDHVLTHEYFLWNHMKANPAFQQYMLQNEPWFPLVFKQPQGGEMPMPGGAPGASPGLFAPPPTGLLPQGAQNGAVGDVNAPAPTPEM